MPIYKPKLQEVLGSMRDEFLKNPEKAVRSKKFISQLHDYCIFELKRSGVSEDKAIIKPEIVIHGSYKSKKVDVVVLKEKTGPLIAISIKSQMSSIGKNIGDYYEGLIGDVISMHVKYPFLVVGQLYLLPLVVIKKGRETEKPPLVKIEKLFQRINLREGTDDRPDKYEHIAMLVVDFKKNPPEIVKDVPSDPELRIEKFFDKLIETYQERNPFLEIT